MESDKGKDWAGSAGAMPGFRRRIVVVTRDGMARAALEDDFHHIRCTLRHDGVRITSVEGQALRIPWVTCPLAADELAAFSGLPLFDASFLFGERLDVRAHCTHMFDLACLAASSAARAIAVRDYRIAVTDPESGKMDASLSSDDGQKLEWHVENGVITSPAPFAGTDLGGRFTAWARAALSVETAEVALLLRRAISISRGRRMPLDDLVTGPPIGACITLRPERAPRAFRVRGSQADWSQSPEMLLRHDAAWLAFDPEIQRLD